MFKKLAAAISILTLALAIEASAQQLDNQNVDISVGSTLSNPSLPVRQLTGGPFTIDNA